MFICQPDIVAIDRNGTPAHTDAHACPLAVRGTPRRAQGRGRGHAAAHSGAARGGGADRLRSHRHPAPIAASHFPPSAAPRRGRAGRALPRRVVGLLPPGRAGGCRHAAQWDRIRKLHVADEAVEAAIIGALAEPPIRALLDLGTGTGRMLELFGPQIERGLGLDLSLDMLALARARLDRAGLRHCSVRQGDIYDLALPKDSFDAVVIHQVLHFLDDGARAIHEAARVLRPAGRLLVVDFAPHDLEFLRDEHAHRRLGFASETVTQWMKAAGLDVVLQRSLAPEPASEGKIAVSLWLGRDPRIALAAPAREVA